MGFRNYQILDVTVRVDSTVAAFLEGFQANYSRFEVVAGAGAERAVRFRYEEPETGPYLEFDGVREELAGCPQPRDHAAFQLVQGLLDRVKAFTVLHAGAVGAGPGVLAVTGASGAGKTTLIRALLETGRSYFSDDFCPVHRDTGRVHPFPRSLWVKAGEGEPASLRGKVIRPLEGTGLEVASQPLPLSWLVCLQDAPGAPGAGLDQLGVDLRKGMEVPFLEAIQAVPGAVAWASGEAWPGLWKVRYPRTRTGAVKEVLARHREACWKVFALAANRPDFTQEPTLTPIPASEAAFFLLRELRHTVLDAQAPGIMKPGALLTHLGGLLAEVACYRLTPGPLARRLELVQDVLDGGVPR